MKNPEMYRLAQDESIGGIPPKSIVKVYILFQDTENSRALAYFPSNVYYYNRKEADWVTEKIVSQLVFVKLDRYKKYWTRTVKEENSNSYYRSRYKTVKSKNKDQFINLTEEDQQLILERLINFDESEVVNTK